MIRKAFTAAVYFLIVITACLFLYFGYEYIVPFVCLIIGVELAVTWSKKNKKHIHWSIWLVLVIILYVAPIYILKETELWRHGSWPETNSADCPRNYQC